mgnify:CR=1 FL=1
MLLALLLSLVAGFVISCQAEESRRIPIPTPPAVVAAPRPTAVSATHAAPTTPTPALRKTYALSETVLDEVGLVWRECDTSQGGYLDWKQAEACFGRPPPVWSDDDKRNSGTRTEDDLRLTVGDDTYETRAHGVAFLSWSTLYQNGRALHAVFDGSDFHPPNISLRNVAGKVAWEFTGEHQQLIIYDGRDTRSLYDLDAAYRPYEIAGKLLFVGKKDEKYFVMYDGQRIGPEFDQIIIAYCCEIALYSVRYGQFRYSFWGTRGDGRYVVEITAR